MEAKYLIEKAYILVLCILLCYVYVLYDLLKKIKHLIENKKIDFIEKGYKFVFCIVDEQLKLRKLF